MASLTLSLLFLLVRFSHIAIGTSSNHKQPYALCIETERAALQEFVYGFNPSTCFASWMVEEDCCKWKGVACNNRTGHITGLDLRSHNSSTNCLQAELRDSLLDLPFLSHLDLSLNDFSRQQGVPEFIGSIKNLEYLNLSHSNLHGQIPNQLGNLSKLHFLDLSGNGFSLMANSLDWLHGMPRLQVLNLGEVDLSQVENWLDAVNMLSSLKTLSLFACRLHSLPASLPPANLTSLEILDLSLNYLSCSIPLWLFNTCQNLVHLNLTRSQLIGEIPNALSQLKSLEILDLSANSLSGGFPQGPSSLKELHLSHNNLKGSFLKSITHLSDLVVLDVSSNLFEDVISLESLNFSHLRVLDLSNNSIQFNKSSRWRPPFQLDVIHLYRCQLGHQFPSWLRWQKDFSSIDISENGISGAVPDWFWNLSGVVEHMDLSHNMLTGKIPDLSSKVSLSKLYLSYNEFSGLLPQTSPKLSSLALSYNTLVGSLTPICESLQANNLLRYLNLRGNRLSGPLPDCLKYAGNLVVMNLGLNNLSGQIPSSLGNLIHLKVLRLDYNAFSGKLPSFLYSLTSLVHVDLYLNMLSGEIPSWIGERLRNLMILSLGNNKLSGKIPFQICQLKQLQVLDLGRNSLSGTIPRCIDNLLTMANLDSPNSYGYSVGADMVETLMRRYGFNIQMSYFFILDLSSNHLSGEVPVELAKLARLIYLNLSNNGLTGAIPYEMGDLTNLEALDLSSNHLSGEVPVELAKLARLIYLNLSNNGLTGAIPYEVGDLTNLEALDLSRNHLSCSLPSTLIHLYNLSLLKVSYNNLSGEIPQGGQFLKFGSSCCQNNDHLCGFPLPKKCAGPVYHDSRCRSKHRQVPQLQSKDHYHFLTFNAGIWMGFVTAISVGLTALLVSEPLREAYFKPLDKVAVKIYVTLGGKGYRRGSKPLS